MHIEIDNNFQKHENYNINNTNKIEYDFYYYQFEHFPKYVPLSFIYISFWQDVLSF